MNELLRQSYLIGYRSLDFSIEDKSKQFIKKNAKITIGSDGLMGNKVDIIIPGTIGNRGIQDKDFLLTTVPVNMDEILLKLKTTSTNATTITDDLAAMTHSIRSGKGTVGKLLMDTVFADNLDKTLVNIKQGAGGFKKTWMHPVRLFPSRGF